MDNNILEGNIKKTIIDLTIPGYYGMLGMSIFNIVDTYFVGKLGVEELQAMSFTFPIVMFVNLITVGLGVGIASLISRAVGEDDNSTAQHVVMVGLILSVLLSAILTIGGLLTIDPVFHFLGASDSTIELIRSYIVVWYLGCVFLYLNMIMGQMFRGLGNTKIVGYLMVAAAVLNGILDPIFIFGFGPIPALEMTGAALATVLSRMITTVIYFYFLNKKYDVLTISKLKFKKMIEQAKRIIIIGIPNSLSKIVQPMIVSFVTMLLASQGEILVAGYGVATKVEALILALGIAFGNTAIAVVGQNLGAKKYERVEEAINVLNKYSIIIFVLVYGVFFFISPYLARIFTDDPELIAITEQYLRIVSISYGFQSIYQVTTAFMNVLQRPYVATVLSFGQFIFLLVPLAYILGKAFNSTGIFIAIAISYIVLGIVCYIVDKIALKKIRKINI